MLASELPLYQESVPHSPIQICRRAHRCASEIRHARYLSSRWSIYLDLCWQAGNLSSPIGFTNATNSMLDWLLACTIVSHVSPFV